MLPKGSALISSSDARKVAQMLAIQHCPALTGFENRCGKSYAVYDGIVVLESQKLIIEEAIAAVQLDRRQKKELAKYLAIVEKWKVITIKLSTHKRLVDRYCSSL